MNDFTTITSKDNPTLKFAAKLQKSVAFRRETGLFAAEGVRICTDAVKSGAGINTFFASERAYEKFAQEFAQISQCAEKTCIVSDKLFASFCSTKSPQGFLCLVKALDKTDRFDTIKNNDKFLALDNIQDPSNLGTILRTAEALDVSGVVLSRDCCDIYSPKVVRGSMGAVFRLPFLTVNSIKEYLLANPSLNSYAAVVDNSAEPLTNIRFSTPCAAVIGNEGNGLKPETVAACTHSLTIPMRGRAESLNAAVAASVIMWEMMK